MKLIQSLLVFKGLTSQNVTTDDVLSWITSNITSDQGLFTVDASQDVSLIVARAGAQQNPCIKHIGEVKVENGIVECNKKICKLKKCDRGFHRLKTDPSQAKATRCIEQKDGKLSWSKELMKCRTCADLEPLSHDENFTVKCGFSSDRAFSLKQCSFSCKNNEKIEPLRKKQMKNVVCSCSAKINSKEKDGNCHCRKQGKTFDLDDKNNFSNWSCGKSASTTTTTPAVTNTITVTTKKTSTTTHATTNPSNTMPPLPPVKGESCPLANPRWDGKTTIGNPLEFEFDIFAGEIHFKRNIESKLYTLVCDKNALNSKHLHEQFGLRKENVPHLDRDSECEIKCKNNQKQSKVVEKGVLNTLAPAKINCRKFDIKMPTPSIVEQCVPNDAICSLDVVIEKFGIDNVGQCIAPLGFLDHCRPKCSNGSRKLPNLRCICRGADCKLYIKSQSTYQPLASAKNIRTCEL